MALSSIALCSRALLKLGAGAITSFDDGTAESEVAANLYPALRDAVLSAHPWNFATVQTRLALLAESPLADYDSAFQLPPDFLRALSAGSGGAGRGLAYRISERQLHCNAGQVVLTYIARPDEADFPAFFDQLLIARLAAEFCLPITESASRAEMLLKLAEDEFRRSRLIDAQQESAPRIEHFPLIEVRR